MNDQIIVEAVAVGAVSVLLIVLVTVVSRRAGWSAPLLLVIAGVGIAFIPGVPRITLDPDFVLVGVLPALLFAAAIRTSFIEVRARGDSIIALSVLLVVFTSVAVGFVTWFVVPGLSLALAIAFGAVLAPTDAVSVTAIAGGLPRRLATILEGESLLNDATALVTLNTAIAAIGTAVTPARAIGDFVIAVAVGVASGVLAAAVLGWARHRLRAPVLDTSLSLVAPYAAFLPAWAIGGSGFLGVVITGLWLGYRSPVLQSAQARIAERINWRTVEFLLQNAVFLLIGLQLPSIVQAASHSGIGLWQGVGICAIVYVGMVASRFVWVLAATAFYRWGPPALQERRWSWKTAVAISFSGVRGVVTLAAVVLLPSTPQLGFLQLLAFVVVVASLLQGLLIGPLIRVLGLPLPDPDQERIQIRTLTAEVQTAALERLEREAKADDDQRLVESLRNGSRYRIAVGTVADDGSLGVDRYAKLRLLMLDSERKAVLQARTEGRYEEATVNAVLADLDSVETSFRRSIMRDYRMAPTVPLGTRRFVRRKRERLDALEAADESSQV